MYCKYKVEGVPLFHYCLIETFPFIFISKPYSFPLHWNHYMKFPDIKFHFIFSTWYYVLCKTDDVSTAKTGDDVSYSIRHVEESWHHLMKSEDTAKFKKIAVCNFDFLLASVRIHFFLNVFSLFLLLLIDFYVNASLWKVNSIYRVYNVKGDGREI